MLMSAHEQELCQKLRHLPRKHNYRFNDEAPRELIQILFHSLIGHSDNVRLFFPNGLPAGPDAPWSLRSAQGAVEGAEYTEAARGKPCGHIFKSGEATYRCKTCTADDTCVLCARCFDASDHEGHQVYVSVSPGNSGCCDCGDDEAWLRPLNCNIHSSTSAPDSRAAGKAKEGSPLPDEVLQAIRMTIARALDYMVDVFSCSPEQLRLSKQEGTILMDEKKSRLNSRWYGPEDGTEACDEFTLVLWNDEKHTVADVRDQVARACKQRRAFGLAKAHEVDDIGRSVIVHRTDLQELLRMTKVIEEIKLTVTIRSARDTFREQMCGTIIEWISDIAGCSVGDDTQILRRTVCEELLRPWRVGSEASNQNIGQHGLYDHEIEDKIWQSGLRRAMEDQEPMPQTQAPDEDEQDAETGNETTASDDDDDDEGESSGEVGEDMDLDDLLNRDNDGDVDMEPPESPDEALEVSEATLAGYPPPPPPPRPSDRQPEQTLTPAESDSEPAQSTSHAHVEPSLQIPETPRVKSLPLRPPRPPKYWLEKPEAYGRRPGLPPHEDLWQRLRLDYLILFDLRMWKQLRISIRDVFISTVVSIPEFKRLLGLRFAGVYTALAQLYLIADREPDHSIINLSLQMLTTPSITAEVVERGNFLTNLMAILYTFLTTRQVGYPFNVDPKATLAFDQGAVTNRRMYHFFMDMKYLVGSEHVKARIREEDRYMLQFLNLVKLHQGICPNVRAVGEHIEYETEAWINASLITREINRLCRQFSEAYYWNREEDSLSIQRAIRCAAKVAILNSLGVERKRFEQSELKAETRFKNIPAPEFDSDDSTMSGSSYRIVDYVVAREPMSFHHGLHYVLSWLVDRAKGMSRDQLLDLLRFHYMELQEDHPQQTPTIPEHQPEEYLLALFDFPLRVCSWLAQMRAGIWVRNGITLRHQMTQYRSVSQRDVSYQRDIFLLQTALVTCDSSVFIASMVDRFGLSHWMSGKYGNDQHGFEDSQVVDVVEDFAHLLIILLSDRTSLAPVEAEAEQRNASIRKDIAHVLCFKPLSFSELTSRLPDKVQNLDEFPEVLSDMAKFRPPEGLSDTGTFELKEQHVELIDPYVHQYNRNQREEAENIYRNYMAKRTGKQSSDIVFEPKLRPIQSGVFQHLSDFTKQPLFCQIVYYLLGYALVAADVTPSIPATRVETYVQFVLQLVLVTVLEDRSEESEWPQTFTKSFVTSVLTKHAQIGIQDHPTILSILKTLLEREGFKSCEPKINLILHRLKQRQHRAFILASEALNMPTDRMETASPASFALQEKELKKKQALERQAKVMASFKEQQGKFMANQDFDWGEEDFSDLEEGMGEPATEQETTAKYPSGTCILCQEETNDQRLYGTFGYVSESSLLRLTNVDDGDWITEVAETPVNLDHSAGAVRPFGVAGRNRRFVEKTSSTGEKITTERQDLGKGFPQNCVLRGPVSTGCGHIMHYTCFEVYLQATQRRHVNQIARHHPERIELKEFMCPLCKALGNMFLPIIWKGKKTSYPGVVEAGIPFDQWIGSELAISLSKLDKNPVNQSGELSSSTIGAMDVPAGLNRQQKSMFEYAAHEFNHSVASRLPEIVKSSFVTVAAQAPPRFQIPAAVPLQAEDPREPAAIAPENTPGSGGGAGTFPILDLIRIYQRLRDTFRTNSISSTFTYPVTPSAVVEDLTHTDALARAIGYSIAAVEIAQRGVQAESTRDTLLDKLSPQSLTHLRVFSETVTSYIAIGSLRHPGSNKTMEEYMNSQYRQLRQLFVGHPNMFDADTLPFDLKGIQPLLLQDPFIFLTECSVCTVPALNLEIHHVLRLCYLAELVRVVLVFVGMARDENVGHGFYAPKEFINTTKIPEQMDDMPEFICCVLQAASPEASTFSSAEPDQSMLDQIRSWDLALLCFIYTMAYSYALPFVRKAAILLHVRYGVELPHVASEHVDEPELDRLSRLLRLPSLRDMLASLGTSAVGSRALRSVVGGWVRHWIWAREGKRPSQPSITLSHPAIFELVGLPKNYDTLTAEAILRKCPTTGKDMTDPCVCLFCGEMMCSQAVCCLSQRGKGGCQQHQEKCGGNIGLYVNIRKCMVLFLNIDNGTWAMAPYLDKHGEADPTLRRSHQLFLNQKRYDILLRKVWLDGGVPSLIARRMEGDMNNGGWETM
ncbi:hypothetical protein EJ04DRAFT_479322 [Polyplosphaeria fusca]|uniref:E3 ubiquitin-protein ligase n=1 Tax=Polyplosphaeria fusca TaxID=682080 RepID=A0A9P4QIU8_9PLEO|nr:hypothetical protein EJ04DRAFT_479322 [Polyplosphaeria fusca]